MTAEELETAAAAEYARLPEAQHARLMKFALTGEIGGGKFTTVNALFKSGHIAEVKHDWTFATRIVMTAKGKAYAKYHTMN